MVRADALIDGLEDRPADLEALYRDLHEHPELSFQEKRTASVMAGRVAAAGLELTTGVGGTGHSPEFVPTGLEPTLRRVVEATLTAAAIWLVPEVVVA
jgi:metal-dependent amidase/aminoacylase/carboxypeptidase family protein